MSTIVLPISVADPTRPRSISSILASEIVAGSSKPPPSSLPSPPPQPNYVPSRPKPSTSRASLTVPSSLMRPGSLRSVLQEPRILARLLRYLRWHDFQSLAFTCRACSNVLHHSKLRDAVLSRFVPGYRYCLRHADADEISSSIEVEFSDLGHFMISQHLPLHHYPTVALMTLSSSGSAALNEKIHKLVMLCQAHSRMILLLQALIHSASSSVQEELDDPSLRYRNSAQQGGRELIFPAPLSFTLNDGGSKANTATPHRAHFRFPSMPCTTGRELRPLKVDPPRRSTSVMSMLRRNTVPPPPPEADPLGLKIYAGSWRGLRRISAVPSKTSEYNAKVFRRPKIEITPPVSSGSSTVNTPSPLSARRAEISPNTMTMPHDIRAATSRLRAPILRVFFPCSKVDHHTITACEAQLDDAGLWQHLSVGDIICNLGYLPPSDRPRSSGSEMPFEDTTNPESWMIFDGTVLVPYTPSAILPIPEPLLLPSPFYYAHITTPPVNPRFIAALPREKPELSLVLLPTRVPSPHSPNGFARIRKYLWIALLRPHVRPGLGEGWHGEWILEGEGTKEGRQSLVDALSGDVNVKREWELVMERCTSTRIWLRTHLTSPSSNIEFV